MPKYSWIFVFIFSIPYCFSQEFTCGCRQLNKEDYSLAFKTFSKKTKNEFLKEAGLASYYFSREQYAEAYISSIKASTKWELQSKYILDKAKKCQLDSLRLREITTLSASYHFEKLLQYPTAEGLIDFIQHFDAFPQIEQAINARDSFLLYLAIDKKKSSSVREFISTYSDSKYRVKAGEVLCEFEYKESVTEESIENLEAFLLNHPLNCKVEQVHFTLYSLYAEKKDISALSSYIAKYPNQPWVNQAWRFLYELYVGEWNQEKITSFRKDYPNYPFLEELTRDLELLNEELYPFLMNNQYGYMNAKGKVIILPEYSEAGFFKNGVAVVQQNDVYGAINKRNQFVIPLKHETLYDFNQEEAIVGDSSSYGIIGKSGNILVPINYLEIRQINPVVYIFQDSLGYRFYNQKGNLIKEDVYQDVSELPGGLLRCRKNNLVGVLDNKLSEVLPYQFEEVEQVNDTLFIVKSTGFFGLYGLKGKFLIPCIYERLKVVDIAKSLILIKKGKEIYLLKFNGTKHFNFAFEYSARLFDLFSFYQNLAVFSKKGKYGLIDVTGNVVLKPTFEDMGKSGLLIPFKQNALWGLLEKEKVKIAAEYDACIPLEKGFLLLEKSGKQGIIDRNGKWIVPCEYNSIKWVSQGYFILESNGLLGIANEDGTILVKNSFAKVKILSNNLILLQNTNEMRYFIPSKALWISAQND